MKIRLGAKGMHTTWYGTYYCKVMEMLFEIKFRGKS